MLPSHTSIGAGPEDMPHQTDAALQESKGGKEGKNKKVVKIFLARIKGQLMVISSFLLD